MRKFLFISLLFAFSLAHAQSKEAGRKVVWEMLKTYHPDAHYFITNLYKMPLKYKVGSMTMTTSKAADFMVYVSRNSRAGVLTDISTVVHESYHMYASKRVYSALIEKNLSIDFDDRYTVYFIDKKEEYVVKHTPTFPSKKMAAEIRGDLRSFRWKTYIQTNEKLLSTQQSGIYGLMNEWTAYYNGMKVIVGGFPEYQKLAKGNPGAYKLFLQDAGSIKISYPEFKYYILHYLEYASRKETKIYDEIIANKEFKKAFWAIDRAFDLVIQRYDQLLQDVEKEVTAAGLDFKLENGYLWIGNEGAGTFERENTAFLEAVNSEQYRKVLEDLEIGS